MEYTVLARIYKTGKLVGYRLKVNNTLNGYSDVDVTTFYSLVEKGGIYNCRVYGNRVSGINGFRLKELPKLDIDTYADGKQHRGNNNRNIESTIEREDISVALSLKAYLTIGNTLVGYTFKVVNENLTSTPGYFINGVCTYKNGDIFIKSINGADSYARYCGFKAIDISSDKYGSRQYKLEPLDNAINIKTIDISILNDKDGKHYIRRPYMNWMEIQTLLNRNQTLANKVVFNPNILSIGSGIDLEKLQQKYDKLIAEDLRQNGNTYNIIEDAIQVNSNTHEISSKDINKARGLGGLLNFFNRKI